MEVMQRGLAYRRLRAPHEDGAVLVDPPLASAAELIEQNAQLRRELDYDVQGQPLRQLASRCRGQLVDAALKYTRQYRDVTAPVHSERIVLAGHQPQLFHAGVWFKNFALAAIARQSDAVAINLIIDSDTIKTASLRVPGGSMLKPLVESVPMDRQTAEIPYEERTLVDRELLRTFGQRVANVIRPIVPHPLVEDFWPRALDRAAQTNNLGLCLAQGRHILEGQWGTSTLEVPQSEVCKLEGFAWFACHLLANLPRLWELYNAAVAEYRRVNHVRSYAHPVPELEAEDGWLEAPFWLWQAGDPRRRRLFVRYRGDEIVISDRARLEIPLTLTPEADAHLAVEQLLALSSRGIKIRTRALITTMFARVMLGDVFLHGIGGAKYDQVTDMLIGRFFGIEPPAYMTATATLRLPTGQCTANQQDARRVKQQLRELQFHPERFLNGQAGDQAADLVRRKQQWIETPQNVENARARCHAIRSANESLQPFLEPLRHQLLATDAANVEQLRRCAILGSREYAFCLYPEAELRKLMSQVG